MGKLWGMLKGAAKDFSEDECMTRGAALAYYTIFSLPPLLALVIYIAGLFGVSGQKVEQIVRRQLGLSLNNASQSQTSESGTGESAQGSDGSSAQAEGSSGSNEAASGEQVGGVTALAERSSGGEGPIKGLGIVSRILGGLILVFSATGLFAQLQSALNRAWEVEPDPEQGGWKNFIFKRVLSLGMIVVIAFLLLVSLVLTTLIDEIVRMVIGPSASQAAVITGMIINNLLVLALGTVLFAAMYKLLPDAEMSWRDTWVGAFITSLLFVIGKTAIGWYLQNSQVGSEWGSAAASMVALLVWVYYSSLLVLFGAELTQAWAKHYGRGIRPEPGAVRVVERRQRARRDAHAT